MAFTVTPRHTGNSGTSSAQTHTSNSTTPTADSLFFAVWGSENDASATAPSFQTPTGGGLTYTQVTVAGVSPSYPWNGDDSFRLGLAAYRAAVGSSPSAFAITVDSSSTTATFFYGEIGFDVTGHDPVTPIVNSAIAGGTKATGNSETGTVAIGWTPAVGNLVIVCFTSGADGAGGFASPTAGAGKTFTTIINQNSASCQVGAFYRVWDGTESLTVTCSDLGDTVGNYGAIVFEVASGSGTPAAADAGLWAPASTGIVMPQSPLYFPFTTPWAGQDITAPPVTAEGGTVYAGFTAKATAVKVAAQSGVCSAAGAISARAAKVAPAAALAVAAATTQATRSVTRPQSGVSGAAATTQAGTIVKVARQSGICSTATVTRATGKKLVARGGTVSAATATVATATKRAAAAATVSVALTIQARATKRAIGNGISSATGAPTAVHRKVAVGGGQVAAVWFSYWAQVVAPRVQSGTCSAGGFTSGRAVHVAIRSGQTAVAGFSRSVMTKRAVQSGSNCSATSAQAGGRKRAPLTAASVAALVSSSSSSKRSAQRGASLAATTSTGQRRALSRFTPRPNTGTTPRPTGTPLTTVRPDNGTTPRPATYT